jgi:hypothetical protein
MKNSPGWDFMKQMDYRIQSCPTFLLTNFPATLVLNMVLNTKLFCELNNLKPSWKLINK